jgi:parallel beta-helix repeat protein
VEIDHFTIKKFPGTGILAHTAVGLNFHDNTVEDNGEYGIARFNSSQTQIVNNTVSGSDEAGIYVGDSPNASALVRRNTVYDNGFGIFLRDSSHGTVTENDAHGNCFGIFLIDSGEPGPAFDWTLVHNTANDNNRECPATLEHPDLSGAGIVVMGANHARLTANTATGNSPGGPTFLPSGGLVIVSGVLVGGPNESYIQSDHNVLSGGPPDLFWDTFGQFITFSQNQCTTSSPGGLCVP